MNYESEIAFPQHEQRTSIFAFPGILIIHWSALIYVLQGSGKKKGS
jgi:hypothetical protein